VRRRDKARAEIALDRLGDVVPLENLLTFIAFSLVIIAIPGPSVMFAISRAFVLGKKGAVLTAVGNGLGVLVQALAISIGLGVLIQGNTLVIHIIRYLGAAFLIYLGVQSIRHRRDGIEINAELTKQHTRHIIRESFLVGLSNPKTIVFFPAVFPQFVANTGVPVVWQMVTLSFIFVAFGITGDSIYAVAAGAAREWFAQSPERVAMIRLIGGVLITGLGVITAVMPS
jgi:threonine/homoserine/homoserine lactone efflux protein